jgi:hypothetical protein
MDKGSTPIKRKNRLLKSQYIEIRDTSERMAKRIKELELECKRWERIAEDATNLARSHDVERNEIGIQLRKATSLLHAVACVLCRGVEHELAEKIEENVSRIMSRFPYLFTTQEESADE